jgi:hypothetical protein
MDRSSVAEIHYAGFREDRQIGQQRLVAEVAVPSGNLRRTMMVRALIRSRRAAPGHPRTIDGYHVLNRWSHAPSSTGASNLQGRSSGFKRCRIIRSTGVVGAAASRTYYDPRLTRILASHPQPFSPNAIESSQVCPDVAWSQRPLPGCAARGPRDWPFGFAHSLTPPHQRSRGRFRGLVGEPVSLPHPLMHGRFPSLIIKWQCASGENSMIDV